MNNSNRARQEEKKFWLSSVAPLLVLLLMLVVYKLAPANALLTALIVTIVVLAFAWLIVQWIWFGVNLGTIVPSSVKEIAKNEDSTEMNHVVEFWASYKERYDDWMKAGISSRNAVFWMAKLWSLKFTPSDVEDTSDLVIRLDSLGMTPEKFAQLYTLGLSSKDDFLTVAEHDIDINMVGEVFTLVSNNYRRYERAVNDAGAWVK